MKKNMNAVTQGTLQITTFTTFHRVHFACILASFWNYKKSTSIASNPKIHGKNFAYY